MKKPKGTSVHAHPLRSGEGPSARDLARPVGVLSIEAELGEAEAFFRQNSGETHVVVRAGTRIVGLLDRRQVYEAVERARGPAGAQRVMIAALGLANAVCVAADCKGAKLDAEISRSRRRDGDREESLIVVVDGNNCAGLLRVNSEGTIAGGDGNGLTDGEPSPGGVRAPGGASDGEINALEGLLGGCSVPSAIFDASQRLLYANRPFLALAGHRGAGADVSGMGWAQFFEEVMPPAGTKAFPRCEVPCSASHLFTLKRNAQPAVHVEAEVDALLDGRQTLVTILRCIKNGQVVSPGCFCRFRAVGQMTGPMAAAGTAEPSESGCSGFAARTIIGRIEHFRLVETTQFLIHGMKTGVLEVAPDAPGSVPGEIVLERGELRHATHGTQCGEAALRSLFAVERGAFRFVEGSRNGPVTIQGSACSVLFAVCVQMDEAALQRQPATAASNGMESLHTDR